VRTRSERLTAVLFDVGDTLVRLRGSPGALVQQAAQSLNGSVAPEAAAQFWTKVVTSAARCEELAKGRDLSLQRHRAVWTALYRRHGADHLLAGLADRIYDMTVDPNSWAAFPDAVSVVQHLRAVGIAIGVVSDTGFDLHPILTRTGLARSIDVVVQSYEHGACKPESSIFLDACRQLRSAPEKTLMVGDNFRTDGGAVDAGLPTLLLPKSPTGRSRLHLVLPLLHP
jgi:FMN phosphatase YigB (HAD superfamily)